MDIVPKNEFISLDKLETYIERYPEDAEKWLEFIREPEEPRRRRHAIGELNEELYKRNLDLTIESLVPIEHYRDGCLFCKKSWIATEGVPTTTLICGHKFHTLCSMVDQYNNDMTRCIVEDCDIDTWAYVRKIVRSKEKARDKAENILLDAYQERNDFKSDLKALKENISTVARNYGTVTKLIEDGRKEFIHKHWYTLNQMQTDLNEGVKYIKQSEQINKYKSSLRDYRKKAAHMFRKYHISFRELRDKGIIRTGWRIRLVLERHRNSFSYYKMGFRMYPGKKIWRDTLEESETESVEENV